MSSPSSSSAGVYRFFEENFHGNIQPTFEALFPRNPANEGLHATLALGENHYHGGVLALLGDIVGREASLTAKLAALAEYSWTALLILDDLGDGEQVRRGRDALWRSEGVLQASQTAWVGGMQVVRILQRMSLNDQVPSRCAGSYAAMMASVGKGQMRRERLDVNAPTQAFVKAMLEITAHFRWWCRLVMGIDERFCGLMQRPLRLLSVAAALKNDLEDLIAPAPNYRPAGSDILSGQVTYPLKVFYDSLEGTAQQEILALMSACGGNSQVAVERITKWFEQSETLARLLRELAMLVDQAVSSFERACATLPSGRLNAKPSQWLYQWINSYKELGNPNLAKHKL